MALPGTAKDGSLDWSSPIVDLLGLRVVGFDRETGAVTMAAPTSTTFANHLALMHGGWSATLLDTVCGAAAYAAKGPGHAVVTVDLKVSYYRPIATDLGTVTITGRALHAGRSTVFTEAHLRDAEGTTLAAATATLAVRPLAAG